ncbi:MAG: 3'-5' exonuclease, partial [Thermodesulfobacteriota bacterium]
LRLLSEHNGSEPRVLTEEDRLEVMRRAAEGSSYKTPELAALVSLAKQRLEGPGDAPDPTLAAAFDRYETAMAVLGALDFDDLVGRAVFLLESDREFLERCRRHFKWILIDEYQDINHAQYRLTRLLAPGRIPDLMVIGDPDQAIYGFRGADSSYFRRFQEDFPGAGTVTLDRNYRSSDVILRASSQVISHNPGAGRGRLSSDLKGPARVTTAELTTPAAEAEYVCRQIERLIGGSSYFALDSGRADSNGEAGLSLGDVSVLYRLHALAGPVAEALAQAGLPCQQAGPHPVRETDGLDFQAEKINLLSMHAAKGLEFEVVFIIGLEEGILPYQPPNKEPADVAEERRLFFVAMTRAKKHLYLTRSRQRTLFGRRRRPPASPFLEEIAQGLKARDKLPDRRPRKKKEQLKLF